MRRALASQSGRSGELRWTPSALDDPDRAHAFILEHDAVAAATTASRILEAVEYLLRLPNLGRPGRGAGTRELVVTGSPFVVIYRIHLDEVQILRVLHHARAWGQ